MSAEWTLDWDVVDEKLQGILEELKAEGKAEINQDHEAVVRERLIAALAPPPDVHIAVAYVCVQIAAGDVKIWTYITGTVHFKGTINSEYSLLP